MLARPVVALGLSLALLCQVWGLILLYAREVWPGLLALLVGGLFAVLILALQPILRSSILRSVGRPGWLALGLVMLATLPVVSAATLMVVALTPRRLSPPSPLEEMSEYTQPPPPPKIHRDTIPAKFVETLSTACTLGAGPSAVRQVRTLSEYMPGYQDPGKVTRLKAFMEDPRADAYHLAVAELGRLQELFTVQIARAQERLSLRPQAIAPNRHLAGLYEEYVNSGLLDESVAEYYWGLAQERYSALAALEPDKPRWRLKRVELLLARDQSSRALEECQLLLEAFPDQMDVRLRLLEIHFNAARFGALEPMRRFLELLEELSSTLDPEDVSPELRPLARFWFPAQPVAA